MAANGQFHKSILAVSFTAFAIIASTSRPGCAASAEKTTASSSKPNIVFVLADDLGYGELGCYGQTKIKTPVLDKLAAEGLKFTDAYAGNTVCAPSRASLMTGMDMGHCQIRGNNGIALTTPDETVAEMLKKQGYATAVIGKWGLGGVKSGGAPNKRGFDYFFGFLSQTAAHEHYPRTLFRNDQVVTLPEGSYSDDLFTSEAVSFVDRSAGKPFFLYLPYTIPHAKMQVPSEAPYASENWPEPERKKAAMITRMDAGIGMVIDQLKKKGVYDNTIIFFASDNGPHKEGVDPTFFKASGPFRGIKRDLYEGGIRIPMIVEWPGHVPAGKLTKQQFAFWDILPTLSTLVNAPAPKGIDGVDITPVLLGRQDSIKRPCLYWEFYERGFDQAMLCGSWKTVRHNNGPVELYNLDKDPAEQHNVADQEPEIAAEQTGMMRGEHKFDPNYPETGLVKKNKKKKKGKKAGAKNKGAGQKHKMMLDQQTTATAGTSAATNDNSTTGTK